MVNDINCAWCFGDLHLSSHILKRGLSGIYGLILKKKQPPIARGLMRCFLEYRLSGIERRHAQLRVDVVHLSGLHAVGGGEFVQVLRLVACVEVDCR